MQSRRYAATTIDDLSSQLAISPRAVKKHLRNLKKAGRLKRIGPDKGGDWEVAR
jgi:predicted ArsR family transcriptional regulator